MGLSLATRVAQLVTAVEMLAAEEATGSATVEIQRTWERAREAAVKAVDEFSNMKVSNETLGSMVEARVRSVLKDAPEAGEAASKMAAVVTMADQFEFGKLSASAMEELQKGVSSFTGKEEYKFGDISQATMAKVTGNPDYKFGDITMGAVTSFTGKEGYEFGDISKAIGNHLSGMVGQMGDIVGKDSGTESEKPKKDGDSKK